MCVLDYQRLISPNCAFMDYTKSSFSRLNCKDENLWVSREPFGWTACLLCNHRRREGLSHGWEEGQERPNVCVYVCSGPEGDHIWESSITMLAFTLATD